MRVCVCVKEYKCIYICVSYGGMHVRQTLRKNVILHSLKPSGVEIYTVTIKYRRKKSLYMDLTLSPLPLIKRGVYDNKKKQNEWV